MLRQSFISLSMGNLLGKECLKRCLLTHKEMYIRLLKMNRRLPMRLLINSKLTKMYSNLVEPANTMKHVHWKKIGGGTCMDHPPRTFTMPILFNSDPIQIGR